MTCQCSSAGTSKNVYKHMVYNRPDLKLKEAEKTIANKDVIIEMLKGQVKKLEQSYMNNMKETENFRFKYCLASEQMKRMRCCSEYCYEKVKTIKEIPPSLCNGHNIAISAPPTPPCCSAQDALINSEKILKSNKELLQLLNKVQVENQNKTSNEEAEHLQKEIARLQLENKALGESLNRYKNQDDFIKKDINVQTNKKDNDAQERLSKSDSIASEPDISFESKHPSEFSRRVSFFSRKPSGDTTGELRNQASRTTQEVIDAAARSLHEMLEKETSEGVNYTQLEHYNYPSDELASIRGMTSRIKQFSGSSVSYANQDGTISNTPIQEICQDDGSCPSNRVSKQIQATSSQAPSDCPCSPITEEEEAVKRASPYSYPTSRINSSGADIPYGKSDEFRPAEATMSIRSDSNQNQMSADPITPITPFNSASYHTLEDDDMGNQLQATPEKTQDSERALEMPNPGTNSEKKNCSAPLLRKLAEIKEKIIDMSEKQDTACRELAIVRDKMAVTHEATENCKYEISKLKERVEEQKVEFLARFEENKEITDDLKQSNEEIRSDLEEVKGQIETLFQTVDELKNNQRAGGRQFDARNNHTNRSRSVSDDIITVEECHMAIERSKSIEEVKPLQDLKKVEDCGCPTDKKLDCVTDLVNQYKRISKDMSSMCPLIPSCMKVGELDEETENYLDKIREDNIKLKATISSVIEHLSEKMKDMNQAIPPKEDSSEYVPTTSKRSSEYVPTTSKRSSEYVPTTSKKSSEYVPTTSKRSCQLSVGVSTEIVCKSECATNTQIEEIFSAPSKCRDLSVSSGSKSPCCCNCDGSQATLEDIYRAVRCSCERRQRFLKKKCNNGSKCIKSAPSSRASIRTIKSNNRQPSSCRCLVGVGKRFSQEQNTIIQSLENYVTYLHTQLRTISSIEKEIEDMRTNIKDPKL